MVPARCAPSLVPRGMILPLVLLLCVASPAAAVFMIPAQPWRPKEAALLKHRDTFHLFYTRGLRDVPFAETWNDLGHATSLDLVNWTELDGVVPHRPGNWDNLQIWSPCIVPVVTGTDTLFYMFYTGITHLPPDTVSHQRIGLNYQSRQVWEKARLHFQQAARIQTEINDTMGLANTHYNRGLLERDRGNIPEALGFLREARANYEKAGSSEAALVQRLIEEMEEW